MGCIKSKELKNTLEIDNNSSITCIMNKPIIEIDDKNEITIKLCADVIMNVDNKIQYNYIVKKKKFILHK